MGKKKKGRSNKGKLARLLANASKRDAPVPTAMSKVTVSAKDEDMLMQALAATAAPASDAGAAASATVGKSERYMQHMRKKELDRLVTADRREERAERRVQKELQRAMGGSPRGSPRGERRGKGFGKKASLELCVRAFHARSGGPPSATGRRPPLPLPAVACGRVAATVAANMRHVRVCARAGRRIQWDRRSASRFVRSRRSLAGTVRTEA